MLDKEILSANLQSLKLAFFEALRPAASLTISQWADRFRYLPEASSSEPGQWRTSRVPYMREIMDILSPQDPHKEVVLIGGSQIAKTEVGINVILYYMDYHPCPIMYLQKTEDVVKRFSRQRLSPSIQNVKSLFEKVGEDKAKDASNTVMMKTFPGGILIMGGTNSPASLRSTPISVLIPDEIDSYEANIGDEGDPVKLAVKRTTNFPRRKIFYTSTPNIKETSRIEPLFLSGDQRYYHVPCPNCEFKQRIVWSQIVWKDNDPRTVYFECVSCKFKIEEHHKTWMLENGKWISAYPDRDIASFHISGLYSPLGWYSWKNAVSDFLEAKQELRRGNKELMMVFVNTVWGETWSEEGRSIDPDWVQSRKEDYIEQVPEGVLVLTAGVDVQADRLECEIVGWGKDSESWSIDYARFMGDVEDDYVWQQMDLYLRTNWKHVSGRNLQVACTCVDSGFVAGRVYKFCRGLEQRRVFSTKGYAGWGRGIIDRPKARNKDGVWLIGMFVDEIKSKVYARLSLTEKGPGFCHFPKKPCYDRNYFQMLTSEKLLPHRVQGQVRLAWELQSGRRNESLDCRVMNVAALAILNPNFDAIALTGPVTVSQAPRRNVILSKGET